MARWNVKRVAGGNPEWLRNVPTFDSVADTVSGDLWHQNHDAQAYEFTEAEAALWASMIEGALAHRDGRDAPDPVVELTPAQRAANARAEHGRRVRAGQ